MPYYIPIIEKDEGIYYTHPHRLQNIYVFYCYYYGIFQDWGFWRWV